MIYVYIDVHINRIIFLCIDFPPGVFLAYITGEKSVFDNVPQLGKDVTAFTNREGVEK